MDPTAVNQPLQAQPAPSYNGTYAANRYPQGYITPDMAKAQYDYAQALLKNSQGAVPGTRGGWTVGAQHLVDALMGGYGLQQANNQQLGTQSWNAEKNTVPAPTTYATPGSATNGNQDSAPKAASSDGADPLDQEASRMLPVIGGMEGRTYDRVVPSVNQRTGQRQLAVGKYGIMDFNVPQWTSEVLGKPMNVADFIHNPQAQDAVAKAKLKGYIQQYGIEGAGRAWLGGPGGVNNPGRKDAFGTSVGNYGRQAAAKYANTGPDMAATPGQQAITKQMDPSQMVAGPGAPSARATTQPPGVMPSSNTYIPPYMVMRRPQVNQNDFGLQMNSPSVDQKIKDQLSQFYYQQNMPPVVPYLGGSVVVNPNNPSQQFFSPGVSEKEVSGPEGMKAPVGTYMAPGAGGKPEFNLVEPKGGLFGGSPGTPSGAAPPKPSVGVPGTQGTPTNGMPPPLIPEQPIGVPSSPVTTAPPAATPVAPPAAAKPAIPAAPVAPAQPPAGPATPMPQIPINFTPGSGSPGPAQPAANQVAGPGAPPNATAPPSITPPETTNQVLQQAEGKMAPPAPTVGASAAPSPINAPMGAKAAQALNTPAPASPPGTPIAGNIMQDMANFGLNYNKQKDLNTEDNKNLEAALKQYYQAGDIAQKGIPMLEVAQKYVNDPRFYSGFLADPYTALQKGKAAVSELFGGNDKAAAAPMEIFQKILSGNIVGDLKMTLGGLGQIRLAEINLITQSVANKYNTPVANKAVLEVMLREHAQAANVARIAQAYQQGYTWDYQNNGWNKSNEAPTSGGLNAQVMNFIAQHPLFNDSEIQNIQNILNTAPHTPNPKVNGAQTAEELTQQAANLGILTGGEPQSNAPAAQPSQAQPTAPAAPSGRPALGDIFK